MHSHQGFTSFGKHPILFGHRLTISPVPPNNGVLSFLLIGAKLLARKLEVEQRANLPH